MFLEGGDDLCIYKHYWFQNYADKIDFRVAEEGVVSIPGCSGVETNVLLQRQAGVKAYGFVDRDSVSDFPHSNETDDERYLDENKRQNQFVYRTVRWEIENYLIDPEVLEQIRVNEKAKGVGKRTVAEVAAELLLHCDVLKVHAAANIVLHQARKKKIEDGFASGTRERTEYEAQVFDKYISEAEKEEYQRSLSKIEAFDPTNESVEKRLSSLIRRVHGKALFMRFFYEHRIQGEKRFSVADKLCTRVPDELASVLGAWVTNPA